jgi:nicotinamidase-related amidase
LNSREVKLKKLDRNTALLVVDVQMGFDDPVWGERNNRGAEASVAVLLNAWRAAGAPVVHIHHRSMGLTGSFRPGTCGSEPKPEAVPRAGELVLEKRVNSAFIGTDLETHLRRSRVVTVVVVGLTTNHCISTTVRMAGNLGFETYVVADATATFDRAGADGRLRPATEVHNAALGDLQGEFAEVIDTKAALAALRAVTPHTTAREYFDDGSTLDDQAT